MKSRALTNDPISFRLSQNLIIIDASINGNGVPMILDTGAAATIISQKAAQKFGLKKAGEDIVGKGAGGSVELSPVAIELLNVGSVTKKRFTGMAMDLSQICGRIGDEVDGIIGHDFLSNIKLTIDYPAKLLFLEEQVESATS